MSGTDFFDDDLVRKRDDVKRVHVGVGDAEAPGEADADAGLETASDELNIAGMTRYREKINGQAAEASEELERLEQRRAQLETEKARWQELQRKQSAYEKGKQEMLSHLAGTLVSLEREEVRADQVRSLLSDTRRRFRELLDTLESVQEETWPEDRIHEELDRMLGFVEEARHEYNQSMGRIQALTGDAGEGGESVPSADYVPPSRPAAAARAPWSYWLKLGLAVTLPVVATMVILFVVYWILRGFGLV